MSDPAALTPLDIRFGASTDLLRLPAVMRSTGLARSTIYRLMSREQFPLPVRLTGRAVGWRRADVEKWNASLQPVAH